jgi:hypothetical protein
LTTRRRTSRFATTWACWLGALSVQTAACGAGRDVIPESHDVQAAPSTSPAASGGYEYIAKRPLGVVAVAESRGLPRAVVTALVDRLADALDACATRLSNEGRLSPAAARVAVHVERDGSQSNLALTLTPGPGPTANALLCFVSPFKLVKFPAADIDPSARGLALEASWGATPPETRAASTARPADPSAPASSGPPAP